MKTEAAENGLPVLLVRPEDAPACWESAGPRSTS
jgi:hypothetical protein